MTPDPNRRNESRGYQLTTVAIVCPILPVILRMLRIYTRLILIKKRFWEDLSIVIALLSVLLQYARVSVLPSDKRLCRISIAVLCTGYLIFIVLRMVRCIPFHALWTHGVPGARCIYNNTWFMFASQGWNMIMDFVILLGPLYILRHSNAPLKQRVLLGVLLAFGGSACIISAIRLHTLYPSGTSLDPTWDKIPSAIYGLVEVNVGISCASVVTLRPLVRRLRGVLSDEADTSERTIITRPQTLVGCRQFNGNRALAVAERSTAQAGSEEQRTKGCMKY
ncbi:hypothetical protein CHGG_00351 [Chaetomium globosum CBS 148.51]|uniref:Rhodopsin domain-containing protein n=1 Tax=Chaetomium globosum (strain ATCC 6205 / CBS 148.51 / DSM 1962 / NBRC 6347 / NRRL 1970) TaxID=306901 RepID=Q2HHF3_CHAGB|nr:uncharacterized protein CHGG_00351 [Chaetomium globosum CBS 148.51]EAQ92116.1 hypothetical protein CHGG_00351 [Chaetomium globosum CBS 148.51]